METIFKKVIGVIAEGRVFSTVCYVIFSRFKFLVKNRLYDYLYKKRIKKMKRYFKYPGSISIENTSVCNARCLMCPHTIMKRKKEIMDDRTFDNVLNNITPLKKHIKSIGVGFFGEALIDPKVIERVKKIRNIFKDAIIEVTTNAALLKPDTLHKLWGAGINRIKVSINATNKKSYEKIMGLNYDKTMENIKYLSDFRKTHKIFTLGSFVSFHENQNEHQGFYKKFRKYFDNLVSCEADSWRGSVKVISNRKSLGFKKAYPCKMLWDLAIFTANGDMVSCCRDYNAEVVYGNINHQSFEEIWFGKKRTNFLDNHLKSKFCSSCENRFDNYYFWWSS